MPPNRVVLGNRGGGTQVGATGEIVSASLYTYWPDGTPATTPSPPFLVVRDGSPSNYQIGDVLEITGFSDGSTQTVTITSPPAGAGGFVTNFEINTKLTLNGVAATRQQMLAETAWPSGFVVTNLTATERGGRVEDGETLPDDYGLFVSKAGGDVLTVPSEDLAFNSSDPGLATLRVIQTGTFQIQCTKTYMGKKGNLEIASDEQMRANAEYTRMYPFELDTQSDADFYSSSEENPDTAGLGFKEGQTEFTGEGYAHQNIQNVYCDYGSTTIEFNPPLPDNIKTPFVSVNFAVANNSGHFHPWYADVTCTPGQEEYQWQYNDSQRCVHMDSAWFRGKWTFRERTFAPFGTNLNNDYGTDQSVLLNIAGSEVSGENQFGLNVPSYPGATDTVYPFSFNQGGATRPDEVGGVGSALGLDLNSPSSVWGGAFKSFAGMQGVSYFANNTHLKIDAFMTPTHTPTPFETEIVKTREANPAADASQYDAYGNIVINDGTGAAWDSGYGAGYKEKLPRMFRTKYWDGSQTEFEWNPLGHANGDFNIAFSINLLTGTTSLNNADLSGQLESESVAMGFDVSDTKIMTDHSKYKAATYGDYNPIAYMGRTADNQHSPFWAIINKGTRFPNQLPSTEGKGYPSNSQYEPGDAFLKTRTFQGQPTGLDSFWNSFSNNTSQWVSSNTPYGEFYYADGGYAMDISAVYNYDSSKLEGLPEFTTATSFLVKVLPTDSNIQTQSLAKHNWHGGNPKAGVGTEGRRFGFGGAGSAESLGGEGEGVFDTYIGTYIVYDIEGSDTNV